MEKRICQIKWQNCFASLLRVIHTKCNGRRGRRQDLIFKTEYFFRGTKRLISVNICSAEGNSAGIFVSKVSPGISVAKEK